MRCSAIREGGGADAAAGGGVSVMPYAVREEGPREEKRSPRGARVSSPFSVLRRR
jgi:hypothetical protein